MALMPSRGGVLEREWMTREGVLAKINTQSKWEREIFMFDPNNDPDPRHE